MTNLPVNPLQSFLKRAANTLPVTTGKVALQRDRLNRRSGQVMILADISASMNSIASGDVRKIDLLREAITAVTLNSSARLFVFSKHVREVHSIPEPEDNTNLAAALSKLQLLDPGVTLVISDGRPDNPGEALNIARSFRGAIDVLYIGPDSDRTAIEFMTLLARVGGGDFRAHDLAKLGSSQKLLGHISGLLQ